jgi:hypothetical protein
MCTVTSFYPLRALVGTSFLQTCCENLDFRRFTLFETSFVTAVVGGIEFFVESLEERSSPLLESAVP